MKRRHEQSDGFISTLKGTVAQSKRDWKPSLLLLLLLPKDGWSFHGQQCLQLLVSLPLPSVNKLPSTTTADKICGPIRAVLLLTQAWCYSIIVVIIIIKNVTITVTLWRQWRCVGILHKLTKYGSWTLQCPTAVRETRQRLYIQLYILIWQMLFPRRFWTSNLKADQWYSLTGHCSRSHTTIMHNAKKTVAAWKVLRMLSESTDWRHNICHIWIGDPS